MRPGRRSSTSSVDKIAFTGSTEVGKAIQRRLAGTGKKLTLELGGKAANIVFDDAALDQAVEGIVNGIYFNQGHVCCAGSRLFLQESIYEPALEKLKQRMATLRVGDPLDKNTDVGAINSAAQLERITELVEAGRAEGADIYQPPCRLPEKGYWFAPTVFTNVAQSYRIAQEEIFGPVLSVLTFRTPEEAVEKANNTPYGLSAGVWTEKGSRILWMTQQLRAGVVWANTFNRFDPTSPFGGYKESGFGREGGLPRPRAIPRVRRVIAIRPALASDEDELTRIDRATWTYITSPSPPPGPNWAFFGNACSPRTCWWRSSTGRWPGTCSSAARRELAASDHVRMISGIAVADEHRRQRCRARAARRGRGRGAARAARSG